MYLLFAASFESKFHIDIIGSARRCKTTDRVFIGPKGLKYIVPTKTNNGTTHAAILPLTSSSGYFTGNPPQIPSMLFRYGVLVSLLCKILRFPAATWALIRSQ